MSLERDVPELMHGDGLIKEEWILFIRSITVKVVDNANVVTVIIDVSVTSFTKLLKDDHDVIMRRTQANNPRVSGE